MADNNITWGFYSLKDQLDQRVTPEMIPTIYSAVQQSAQRHTSDLQRLYDAMVEVTTDRQRRIILPVTGGMQPLDEWGVPRPVQGFNYYEVGFPIFSVGTAWGGNRISRAHMTVRDANLNTLRAQTEDATWLMKHVMAAVFDNTTYTHSDPFKAAATGDTSTTVTVQPLANGDSVLFPRKTGDPATDNHYLAQADSIDDSHNPFPTLYKELAEHPDNRGPYVAYIAEDLVSDVTGLAGFHEVADPDIIAGISNDRLGATIDKGPGTELLGKVDKMWIIQWDELPDSYILAHSRNRRFIAQREYEPPELRGFYPEAWDHDGNTKQLSMLRHAGHGVFDRTAAAVQYIGASSYAIPSGYTVPLPV